MANDPLHSTLRRQLCRLQLSEAIVPHDPDQWRELLFSIDRAYREADEMVYLVTNAERIVNDELAQSQQALAIAQRLSGLGGWTYETDSGDVIVSEELANLLEIEPGRVKMSSERMLEFVHPVDRETAMHLLGAALVTATNRTGEVRFLTSSGVERWCLCRIASYANGVGKVIRLDGTVLDISERRAAEEHTRQVARTDPLTGLANRSHFFHVLSGALDQTRDAHKRAAVILVDLDGFKAVNDTCGHPVGDALLDTIARRLRACLRSTDTVARFGADEFVLLIKEVGSDDELAHVTQRILKACATTVAHEGESTSVSASVGVALFPSDGQGAEQLIQSADAAMYLAKQSGRNNVRFFGDEVRARRHADRAMVASLRSAIARGQISVAFQPIVDGETLQILGTEALARWSDATLGPVSPAQFVVLAEENGLIGDLSSLVILDACERLAALPPARRDRRCVSVNISPLQLRSAELFEQLQALLRELDLEPPRLCIEVNERAIVGDPGVLRALHALRELGVTVWLDDFGTRPTSLDDLRSLPVDGIKIDRSLISAIEGSTVDLELQGLIDTARLLGCEVLAEGVETRQQRTALLDAGCRMMQGYLFGLPDCFERWHPLEPAELAH